MLECSQHPLTKPQRCAALAWAGLAALAVGLVSAFAVETDKAQREAKPVEANAVAVTAPPAMTLETFLDRLMMAESGGQDAARNPRSTAVGPFQFIQEAFLDVVRRHFAEETMSLSTMALLKLREDRAFARRAVHEGQCRTPSQRRPADELQQPAPRVPRGPKRRRAPVACAAPNEGLKAAQLRCYFRQSLHGAYERRRTHCQVRAGP
jgi:hypothetical protein